MKKKVYAYLHTHWDLEWYRTKQDFNLRLLDVFDMVIDELTKNNAPFFYFDGQIKALLDYLTYRPQNKEIVLELIKNDKLAIGPYYTCIDSFLVNYKMMLKNLEIGKKISKIFNQKHFIGNMCDIFGISKSAFMALINENIDKALIWRGVNPEDIDNCCNFKYDNLNVTWLAQGYFNDFFHSDLPLEKKIENITNHIDKIDKYSNKNCLLPIGADHLGILQNANQKIKEINQHLKKYEIILTSPFEYFKNNKYTFKTQVQEFLDNKLTYILPGVYSSRIYQKRKNAILQNDISRKIEPLNHYLKDKFQPNIEEVYELLLTNQAHDGICGCSLDSVHREIDSRQEICQNILTAIEKRIIGNFKKKNKIREKSNDTIGLFNLSNNSIKIAEIKLPYILQNSQVIKIEKGFEDELYYDIHKIPVTENITNLYTQLIELDKNNGFSFTAAKIAKPKKRTKITTGSIENDNISLNIKNKKIIITNKTNGDSFYLKITDIKDSGDSYNSSPEGRYKLCNILKTEINYSGEIESSLLIYFKNLTLEAKLDNYSDFITFSAKINNKKKNHKLQICAVLRDKIYSTKVQDAVGTIERKVNPNYNIQDYMPAKRPIELKTNFFPMQSFVTANNMGFLTKGLNEYEVFQNELKICLLRAFGTISNPQNKTRSIPAGPDLKTIDSQCMGENNTEFAIFFGDTKKAFQLYDIFYKNYIVTDGNFNKKNNFTFDNIPKNSFIYGISKKKVLTYDIKNDKII